MIVFRGAASPFSRKSKFPLSSTMQMVTLTFCRCASASAAATMVLTAARFRYFLLGSSAADATTSRHISAMASLNMAPDASSYDPAFPPEFRARTLSIPESLRRSGLCLRRFFLAVLGWGAGFQCLQQPRGDLGNFIDCLQECRLVCLGRFRESADLAHELE